MSAAAVLCACGECRALDAEFPNDGHQLALVTCPEPTLITAAQDRSSAIPPMQPADDATPRRANALSRRGATSLPNLPTKENLPRRSPMFKTMTIGELCVSPYNVRTNQADATAIVGMAESLLKRGQLYPLVVHPMPTRPGKKKLHGALAGGRRYRAFSLLITQGKLPADHPITVIVRDITDEGELRELSLAENIVRVDLRDYEKYAAVALAHRNGRTFQEIADTNGQSVEVIRQWNRLGNLAEPIFEALEKGEIGTRHAMAFGATDDHEMQMHAFRAFMLRGDREQSHAPSIIRRLLKV
nr:ParB/RepB/Spo0J family partition protein [Sphingobium sp.]